TSKANDSAVLPPEDKVRVAEALEEDAQVMSNTQLEELVVEEPEIEDELVRINTEARPFALQVALLVPLIAALLGLAIGFRMRKLPDPAASSAGEGMLMG
ncbi:MAG TPA: MFS transporter, partial [Actinomycetota bacterium]|nr:MFS transporter [Actinomycetota bacterium]